MSKNDDRILELKKQIEMKKQDLSKRKARFVPETNCILELDGNKYNLNVMSAEELTLLVIKLNMFIMSSDALKLPHPIINGYVTDLWIADISNKLETLSTKKKEFELKQMESKLDKMLSDDKKTELELDGIAALLK